MASDTDEDPLVPIVCPECDTTSRVPIEEVADMIERHNDHQHDGDDVARVDPEIADALADMVAEDLGLLE